MSNTNSEAVTWESRQALRDRVLTRMSEKAAGGEPITILFVCTGNICRSPYAELAFRQRLREAYPGVVGRVVVSSGSLGVDQPDPGMYKYSRKYLVEVEGVSVPEVDAFRNKNLAKKQHRHWYADADLLLTFEAAHAVGVRRKYHDKLFTITEFVTGETGDIPDPLRYNRGITTRAR